MKNYRLRGVLRLGLCSTLLAACHTIVGHGDFTFVDPAAPAQDASVPEGGTSSRDSATSDGADTSVVGDSNDATVQDQHVSDSPTIDVNEGGDAGGCPPEDARIVEKLEKELDSPTGTIELGCEKKYYLSGTVGVAPGKTLRIRKGTTIFAQAGTAASLVVPPSARIEAEGTADEPIVFTSSKDPASRRAGDWCGLILLGSAPTNAGTGASRSGIAPYGAYGGNKSDDNSGWLRYVRIEYAGGNYTADQTAKAMTFAGVGRGTSIDHVQVFRSGDDCFKFYGGTVDAKHLVCYRPGDEGIDASNGWTGRIQFFVMQQDPTVDKSSNGIALENDDGASGSIPVTEPTVYNATLCGQNLDGINARSKEQLGVAFQRKSRAHVFNSLILAFDSALAFDAYTLPSESEIKNSTFVGNTSNAVAPPSGAVNIHDWAMAPANQNMQQGVLGDGGTWPIPNCFSASAPDFRPASPLQTNAKSPPDDGFFDAQAKYVGAFRDTADTWVNAGTWIRWGN